MVRDRRLKFSQKVSCRILRAMATATVRATWIEAEATTTMLSLARSSWPMNSPFERTVASCHSFGRPEFKQQQQQWNNWHLGVELEMGELDGGEAVEMIGKLVLRSEHSTRQTNSSSSSRCGFAVNTRTTSVMERKSATKAEAGATATTTNAPTIAVTLHPTNYSQFKWTFQQ